MAYLVLALGAFLSIGGALSIFHGAGIVEIERGWTGVIAGATALTGGIITIALGLILKTLLDLRGATATRPLREAQPADVRAAHEPEDRAIVQPSLATPAGEPTSLMTAELESGMLAAILDPSEPVAESARPFGAPVERTAPRSLPVGDVFEPLKRESESPLHDVGLAHDADASERKIEHDDAGLQPPISEPAAEKSRFKINFRKQPASLPQEPVPAAVPEPEAPAMDDWLDRAFSALENEPPLGAPVGPRHKPEDLSAPSDTLVHATPAMAEAAVEPVHEAHDPEPTRTEPPAPPASTSAVIGRYEADGTSYVMYADGSIEAQSEAGVYRFNSMTELKAFIENA